MAKIQMYTTVWCGYCDRARALLSERGLPFEEISLDDDPAFRARLLELTGRWTVPQILVDGKPIGGFRRALGARPPRAPGRAGLVTRLRRV
jgi:glutaredoxin 3